MLVADLAMRMEQFSEPEPKEGSAAIARTPTSTQRSWKLFRPFLRGMLNIDAYIEQYGPASAESACLGDFQTILEAILLAPPETDETQGDSSLKGLGIPRSDWELYNVILVIPDLFVRSHVKKLVELVLDTMGFSAICLQNESVSATFGAGLSSACVVDLGAERIGISCVDDGLVVPESRIELLYGGNDISNFLQELLHRAALPYHSLDIHKRLMDRLIVEDIKERALTLHPSEIGLNFWDFQSRLPGRPTNQYKFRMYDESIVAPLLLFMPRVVDFENKVGPKTRHRLWPLNHKIADDVEDPGEPSQDGELPETVTMLHTIKHLLPPPAPPTASTAPAPVVGLDTTLLANRTAPPSEGKTGSVPPDAAPSPAPRDPALAAAPTVADASNGTPQPTTANGTPGPQSAPAKVEAPPPRPKPRELGINVPFESSKTPLDLAVWSSIMGSTNVLVGAASTTDRLRKMASNVLCVGGSALIPGLGAALEARLNGHIDHYYSRLTRGENLASGLVGGGEAVISAAVGSAAGGAATPGAENAPSAPAAAATGNTGIGHVPVAGIIPTPRDMDPRIVCWKGAAVMSRLDSTGDYLVTREDWDLLRWRAIREKT